MKPISFTTRWIPALALLTVFSFTIIPESGFAQVKDKGIDINIWQTNAPDTLAARPPLTTSDSESLEKFSGPDDAIIYIYRLPAMMGAVVKWQVLWNEAVIGKLKQNDYTLAHINTVNQVQQFSYTGYETKYKFVSIKPGNYYFIEIKGIYLTCGPLNTNALAKIKSCNNASMAPK
jgi:hypothetical protein